MDKDKIQHHGYQLMMLGKEIMACGEAIIEESNSDFSQKKIRSLCNESAYKASCVAMAAYSIKHPLWMSLLLIIVGLIAVSTVMEVLSPGTDFVVKTAATVIMFASYASLLTNANAVLWQYKHRLTQHK